MALGADADAAFGRWPALMGTADAGTKMVGCFFFWDTRKGKKRINTTNSGRHGGLKLKPLPHGQGNKRRGRRKRSHSFTARYVTEEEKEKRKLGWLGIWLTAFNFFIGQVGAIAVAIAQFRPLHALGPASG